MFTLGISRTPSTVHFRFGLVRDTCAWERRVARCGSTTPCPRRPSTRAWERSDRACSRGSQPRKRKASVRNPRAHIRADRGSANWSGFQTPVGGLAIAFVFSFVQSSRLQGRRSARRVALTVRRFRASAFAGGLRVGDQEGPVEVSGVSRPGGRDGVGFRSPSALLLASNRTAILH